MAWLKENVEWLFSGIGVYTLSLIVMAILAIVSFIFRKKIKAAVHKVIKVFVLGWGNNININQDDGK